MSTIKSAELKKKLRNTYLCRCKFWVICNETKCYHYEPHAPKNAHCIYDNPVKWCGRVRGFVFCVPINEIDSNYECDPNLAFKAKTDAEKRVGKMIDRMMSQTDGSMGITIEDMHYSNVYRK